MSLLAGLSQQGDSIADAQPLDSDLTALAGLSTTGLVARTGAGTAATRTITGTDNQITVTNGDGVAGNPTLSLPQDIATTSSPTFAGATINGNVGIGTNTPSSNLEVWGSSPTLKITQNPYVGGNSSLAMTAAGTGSSTITLHYAVLRSDTSSNALFLNPSGGYVGIGTVVPSSTLHVASSDETMLTLESTAAIGARKWGFVVNPSFAPGSLQIYDRTQYSSRIAISTAGTIQFGAYGAGTLVTDSSGNITASSDASLKTVTGPFSRGLEAVLKLTPRTYQWNEKSGMNTEDENVGFIAQEVLESIPEAVGQYRTSEVEVDGKKTKKREKAELLTLSDRPLIAALVNAVRELNENNTALEARVAALENGKASK